MRVWIHEESDVPTDVILHIDEPTDEDEEFGVWGWNSKNGGIDLCRKEIERLIGCKVPPRPALLEVELTARVVKEWEPT